MSAQAIPPLGMCSDCSAHLTLEEAHYYEIRCEPCERVRHDRLQRWKAGEPDAEFDRIFGDGPVE